MPHGAWPAADAFYGSFLDFTSRASRALSPSILPTLYSFFLNFSRSAGYRSLDALRQGDEREAPSSAQASPAFECETIAQDTRWRRQARRAAPARAVLLVDESIEDGSRCRRNGRRWNAQPDERISFSRELAPSMADDYIAPDGGEKAFGERHATVRPGARKRDSSPARLDAFSSNFANSLEYSHEASTFASAASPWRRLPPSSRGD